jgi:drug/metabolite transporter (DMT)-like permease
LVVVPLAVSGGVTLQEIRRNARCLIVVAFVNVAIPFWLLSWGETRIDSGLASILQAAVPIFNAVLAFAFFREVRVTGLRLVGVVIGFAGVALLVGAQPEGKVLSALAVVGMALCYAVGSSASAGISGVQPSVVALRRRGLADARRCRRVAQARTTFRAGRPWLGGRRRSRPAIAFLLFYAIIAGAGAAFVPRHHLVPPIAPPTAVFLDERFGAASAASR